MSSDSPAAILFDELGNPVGVIFDGYTYRLQVQATISDGYSQLGTATNPLRIDPVGQTVQPVMGVVVVQGNAPIGNQFKGYPLVIAGIDENNNIRAPQVDGYGSLFVKSENSTATDTIVIDSSLSNTTLLFSNIDRKGATIYNSSTSNLFVKLGLVASNMSYTILMASNSYYEIPFSYIGNIDGIWSPSADGYAIVNEFY